nr:BRO family protein [Variovorax sp. PBL-E5]
MPTPGLNLRTILIGAEPWFVAVDVCKALGMNTDKQGTGHYLAHLDADEVNTVRSTEGKRGNPNLKVISESGLYSLILRSRKPEAKAFKKWVTSVVLPAIRKDGAYVMGEEKVVTGEMSAGSID